MIRILYKFLEGGSWTNSQRAAHDLFMDDDGETEYQATYEKIVREKQQSLPADEEDSDDEALRDYLNDGGRVEVANKFSLLVVKEGGGDAEDEILDNDSDDSPLANDAITRTSSLMDAVLDCEFINIYIYIYICMRPYK